MAVRYLVAWLAVGLGISLLGCGGSSKDKPSPTPTCTGDVCPDDCEPGGKFCFERQIWKCAADGKSATSLEACSEGEECQDAGVTVRCESVCEGAACEPPVPCTPNQRECRDGDVFECDEAGEKVRLYDDCDELEICDPVAFTCMPVVCEPGAKGCLGTQITECSAAGTGFQPALDCASTGETCLLGECVEPVCKAGDRVCLSNAVHICNLEGTALVHNEACGDYATCIDESAMMGFAYCKQKACVAQQKICDNNTAKVCADDGSIPAEGTDCEDDVCQQGECLPKICEPFERLCVEGVTDVHECGQFGTTTNFWKTCPAGTRCGLLQDAVDCVAQPCVPATTACLGNAVGTCAATGQSLSAVTQNCAATQLVCNATPTCSASAVDTTGANDNVESVGSDVAGNIIDVHSSRRLTKLEANMILDAPRDLRWVVYEQMDDQQYDLLCSEVTANNNGSAFFSSSAFDCQLLAGKRYYIGVAIVVGEGNVYLDMPPLTGTLSFGRSVGGARGSYGATTYAEPGENAYRLRLTTELP